MRVFSKSAIICASADDIWAVMHDVVRWPEWTPSVTWATVADGAPLRIGSVVKIKQPKFPAATWRVTALEPERSFTWVSKGPGVLVTAEHTVEAVADTAVGIRAARATLTLTFSGLLGPWFGALTKNINEEYLTMEIQGLQKRCEQNAKP